MSKIDTIYSKEEIEQIATRDFVITSLGRFVTDGNNNFDPTFDNKAVGGYDNFNGTRHIDVEVLSSVVVNRYSNDGNRKIGLIRGIMDDGSFIVSILGNGVISRQTEKSIGTLLGTWCSYPYTVTASTPHIVIFVNDASEFRWINSDSKDGDVKWMYGNFYNGRNGHTISGHITEDNAINWVPNWQTPEDQHSSLGCVLHLFGYKAGQKIDASDSYWWGDIQLTDSKDTTLTIGNAFTQYQYTPVKNDFINNGYKNIGGSLYDINSERILRSDAIRVGQRYVYDEWPPLEIMVPPVQQTTGTYAQHYIPWNLILTRNESEAINYLTTGIIPSDAFIYPYDVDNIPVNDSGVDPGDETSTPITDTENEDGSPVDDCQDMETETPDYTPQSLTNNNLYWLSALGLQQFINWFWTDATDIASVGDLWDKIKGLYENLAESILQIRYMPIEISWVGGTSADTKIIVGMIEKQHAVATINKSVAPIRRIGHIDVKEIYNGSWVNFTPYSSMSLYLPFHGMVEIDNDFVMGHKIYVEVIYDILAGTIQYFLHRDSYSGSLIYSCVAKMAVDIPITLQTKTQRDSAVYSNVANMTAGLIGAGASAVAGSPVGMTMGLANLASYQPSSAGMRVIGNIGESGAFYAPKQCALYIKRPAYNRPSNYKSHVGYPANTTRKLQSCSGFTTCYNPRITFAGNTHTENGDTVTIKPTKSEVEKIYDYLEKGVII